MGSQIRRQGQLPSYIFIHEYSKYKNSLIFHCLLTWELDICIQNCFFTSHSLTVGFSIPIQKPFQCIVWSCSRWFSSSLLNGSKKKFLKIDILHSYMNIDYMNFIKVFFCFVDKSNNITINDLSSTLDTQQ